MGEELHPWENKFTRKSEMASRRNFPKGPKCPKMVPGKTNKGLPGYPKRDPNSQKEIGNLGKKT